MAHRLLFEIGCEELPARFVPDALHQLEQLARDGLRELRITHGDIRTLGTPRRLALLVDGLSEKQADAVEDVKGPAERAAFDEEGRPTKAALGFARSQGVSVDELVVKDTPQGRYVFASKREEGRPTREVIGPWLASLVGKISFPKSMRWADATRFA
ncbi:MAG TPA: glycine--tRNA ligase subunit beta, partial [Limnochordales bacterium]